MATQEEINRVVAGAAAEYQLSARAQRLLQIALEILVFEIGPAASVSEKDLAAVVFNDTARQLLIDGERGDLRPYLVRNNLRSALAILRILSHPRDVGYLLRDRLPNEVQNNVSPFLDKH